MHSVGEWWMWLGFFVFISLMLATDMFLLGNDKKVRVTMREALAWSCVWISCALIFDALLWWYLYQTISPVVASQKAQEFLTGFLIEKSLSIDNLFVFIMIFSYFKVPSRSQRRVLLYGVGGAVILRFVMIAGGTWLVRELHWVLYLFGLFLLFTGIKMFFHDENSKDLATDPLTVWLSGHLKLTQEFHGEKFFVLKNGVKFATPLVLTLILIEISDVIFALDSIPAIFAITQDTFIVFTSNIFAILGLRALYFLLKRSADKLHLLKYGVAIILIFIGMKMLIEPWFKFSSALALTVVAVILVTTGLLSFAVKDKRIR